MKTAISLNGAPVSGKSTLLKPYEHRVIGLGNFAHSLEPGTALREECEEHWARNAPFSAGLVAKLLDAYPYPEVDWYLLDGTPRTPESLEVVQSRLDILGYINITLPLDAWEGRMQLRPATGRSDSTPEQLRERKRVYDRDIAVLETLVGPWYTLENTGTVEKGCEKLDLFVNEILGGAYHD